MEVPRIVNTIVVKVNSTTFPAAVGNSSECIGMLSTNSITIDSLISSIATLDNNWTSSEIYLNPIDSAALIIQRFLIYQ